MSPGQNLNILTQILFCLFIFISGYQKMKIEVSIPVGDFDSDQMSLMCMGKKMKIIAIFVDIFFILPNL